MKLCALSLVEAARSAPRVCSALLDRLTTSFWTDAGSTVGSLAAVLPLGGAY